MANIDLVAHGQFGNWCIQHLCEHGSPPDKRRVINHILCNAYNYSLDQFASKVVEKCLKIGGVEFLEHYLGIITTAHQDRPRIPLIDISGDQYGNYLIQWILMNTHHHQREQVAVHIRKHMVSLRGSKYGCRVAMLCCDPASMTRSGPGVIINPFWKRRGIRRLQCTAAQMGVESGCPSHTPSRNSPTSTVLVRLDGLYGDAAPLLDVLSADLAVIARSRAYHLLDLDMVKRRLLPCSRPREHSSRKAG